MSSTSAYATLQPHHLHNLILILRHANARYSNLAACIRASLTPTRHAKHRAQNLGLTVNIIAAVNCPQSSVSVIPLPIIEIVSPLPVQCIVQKRPVLTCTIPVMQTITSPNGTTSALSTASAYSAVTLTSAQPVKPANVPKSHWSAVTDDDERFPRDATSIDACSVRAVEQTAGLLWQPLNVPIDEDAMDWDLDLLYPQDSPVMDISPCTSASSVSSTTVSPTSSPSSGSEAGSESSESSESSAGPITPPSAEVSLPLMIPMKRKSMEIRDIDDIADDNMSDKRVRVDAESTQTQHRNVIRMPARR
ncbi:hypothetical protein C0991_001749 [Blastosporella zonata]|nr:hypothetical protein C0991_001749 [Blastosporella zonata]